MSLTGKSALVLTAAMFTGASLSLWLAFGGDVYAAYLSGVPIRCF